MVTKGTEHCPTEERSVITNGRRRFYHPLARHSEGGLVHGVGGRTIDGHSLCDPLHRTIAGPSSSCLKVPSPTGTFRFHGSHLGAACLLKTGSNRKALQWETTKMGHHINEYVTRIKHRDIGPHDGLRKNMFESKTSLIK